MKNTLFLAVLITAVITATSTYFVTNRICCNPVSENKATTRGSAFSMRENSLGPLSSLAHPYPIDTAVKDIDTFQAVSRRILQRIYQNYPDIDTQMVVAYTISSKDLVTALGAQCDGGLTWRYPFARVYLGFSYTQGFKLFLVAVDTLNANNGRCGRDIFFDIDKKVPGDTTLCWVHPVDTFGAGSSVLDLISPCPFICDTSSRLMRTLPASSSCSCNPVSTTAH